MSVERQKIKKYSSKNSITSLVDNLSTISTGDKRPFAPLNISEKWRLHRSSNIYKASVYLVIAIIAIGFYLGKQNKSSQIASADSSDQINVTSTTTKVQSRKIIVYVTGEVNSPGVVQVQEGARIFEAIEMAGGSTALSNISACDLASKVIDGTTIYIPKQGENVGCSRGQSANAGGNSSTSTVINLNTATQAELETLPGVGPALASTIISYREENGGFSSVNDLRKVSGIGDKKFSDLKDLVSV